MKQTCNNIAVSKTLMRILITRSSGQLGAEIARQLTQRYEIIGVDVIPGEWTRHVMSTDQDAVDTIMKDIDAIIHISR